jgi:putative DNA primase/helicase
LRAKSSQPEKDPLKPRIESREDGVYWIVPKVDKESGNIINNENWLASAMDVIGSGRDDKDQYLILRWLAFGSDVPTTAAIPWRILESVKAGAL